VSADTVNQMNSNSETAMLIDSLFL